MGVGDGHDFLAGRLLFISGNIRNRPFGIRGYRPFRGPAVRFVQRGRYTADGHIDSGGTKALVVILVNPFDHNGPANRIRFLSEGGQSHAASQHRQDAQDGKNSLQP